MDTDLPSTVQFVNRLITQLSQCMPVAPLTGVNTSDVNQSAIRNPLSSLSPSELAPVKSLILTLHCLFPNELLLALDILDRKLIRRFVVKENNGPAAAVVPSSPGMLKNSTRPDDQEITPSESTKVQMNPTEETFFVISASSAPPAPGSPPSSAFYPREPEKGYEVRLRAWSCTCPTFALSAFRDSSLMSSEEVQSDLQAVPEFHQGYRFGGTLTCEHARLSPPVCKHLLACILAVRCPALFGVDSGDRRGVSVKELAGWCAGWAG